MHELDVVAHCTLTKTGHLFIFYVTKLYVCFCNVMNFFLWFKWNRLHINFFVCI